LEAVNPHRKIPTYLILTFQGDLDNGGGKVFAIILILRSGDPHPKIFVCTDLKLSVQQALRYFQKRWPVEVYNFYLKEALGLDNF
jgi:hypothetical protein